MLGRPNTGKSTLTNALVGTKVAIMSDRPQTTRHTIRGIVHRPDAQLVLVDTPGFHRPRTLLGQRLNDLVMATVAEVDVVVLCVPADQKVGPGDRFIAAQLAKVAGDTPVIAVVTKTDLAGRQQSPSGCSRWLTSVSGPRWSLSAPSTTSRSGCSPTCWWRGCRKARRCIPTGELTDSPEQIMVAELIREAALAGVRDELPHSIAVVVEEIRRREGRDDLIESTALLYVERDSQKGIVIGVGGQRLREVGEQARRQIEALLGSSVYLDLRVKVAKDWQRDPKQLRKLGF